MHNGGPLTPKYSATKGAAKIKYLLIKIKDKVIDWNFSPDFENPHSTRLFEWCHEEKKIIRVSISNNTFTDIQSEITLTSLEVYTSNQ